MKMTLREALSKKKMLDKQILDIYNSTEMIIIKSADVPMVKGMPTDDYKEFVKQKWQSLNDKIAFRDTLANAILDANVANKITVPKFRSLETLSADSKETEEISFASAIARKEYYKNCLAGIVNNMINIVNSCHKSYTTKTNQLTEKIENRLKEEFAGTTNASTKQRQERQTYLEELYKVEFIDPVEFCKKTGDMKTALEDYLCKIDSLLGTATDTTYVEIPDDKAKE